VDERFYWTGTANFATEYPGIYLTNYAWWWVNVPSMIFLPLAAVFAALRTIALPAGEHVRRLTSNRDRIST